MIVNRKKLSFWERLYLPAILGGIEVTARHFLAHASKAKRRRKMPVAGGFIPRKNGRWPKVIAARLISKDPAGNTKCVSCQLCEFVCPPKAIKLSRPAR